MLKIKKGDSVIVISGTNKGVKGTVERVFPKKGKVFIPGVGLYKKHIKPSAARDGKGGVFELFRPIAVNKVALLDPKSGKPTRVRFEKSSDKKLRVSAKSGQPIDK